MTGEDLEYRPSVLEQKKFDYSPLGKGFTKGLDKDDNKEGILKILKNIQKSQNSNNKKTKNKKNNDEGKPSSAWSKSSIYLTPLSSARRESG